jgi:hypothetical protein
MCSPGALGGLGTLPDPSSTGESRGWERSWDILSNGVRGKKNKKMGEYSARRRFFESESAGCEAHLDRREGQLYFNSSAGAQMSEPKAEEKLLVS